MAMRRARWLVLAAGLCTTCRGAERAPGAAASAHVASAHVASASVAPPRVEAPPPTLAPPIVPVLPADGCRALRVKGDVRSATGEAIAAMSPLDGKSWIELAPGAQLVARHTVSARELLLEGPGRVLPCRRGREQVLIAAGTFKSAPGTGVRPGAEVLIGTPFGSARYGDADFELTVAATRWTVAVKNGTVWTEPAVTVHRRPGQPQPGDRTQTSRPADGRIGGGERGTAQGSPNPERLASVCSAAAQAARGAAEALLSESSSDLGERTASQLALRQKARAACATAAAALNRVTDPTRRSRLGDQVAAADELWEGVPTFRDVPLTVSSPRR